MPIYAYRCPECGLCTEEPRDVNDRDRLPSHVCAKTGETTGMARRWATPGLNLKGPGFHCNDYPKEEK
jgi:putative FmdB family regulatory protein